jgi:Spy/CpxP family protein refolding chaperone
MLRTTIATLLATAISLAVMPAPAEAQESGAKAATAIPGAKKSGRIPVNGVDYYYEIAG